MAADYAPSQLRLGPEAVITAESVAVTVPRRYWSDALKMGQCVDGCQYWEAQCDTLGEQIATCLKMLVRRQLGLDGEKSRRDYERVQMVCEVGPNSPARR